MTEFQKALAEDLRRFGLVLLGAGILTPVSPTTSILAVIAGFLLVSGAYIILVIGDKS